jgi:hypothetical protein
MTKIVATSFGTAVHAHCLDHFFNEDPPPPQKPGKHEQIFKSIKCL